jgi:hypothetical protein
MIPGIAYAGADKIRPVFGKRREAAGGISVMVDIWTKRFRPPKFHHEPDTPAGTCDSHEENATNPNPKPTTTMLAKYKVEYAISFHGHDQHHHFLTDDPVACEGFLAQLLERGFKIKEVLHQGVALPQPEFDRLVRTAAGILSTQLICRSLGIDSDEAHRRFGVPS